MEIINKDDISFDKLSEEKKKILEELDTTLDITIMKPEERKNYLRLVCEKIMYLFKNR